MTLFSDSPGHRGAASRRRRLRTQQLILCTVRRLNVVGWCSVCTPAPGFTALFAFPRSAKRARTLRVHTRTLLPKRVRPLYRYSTLFYVRKNQIAIMYACMRTNNQTYTHTHTRYTHKQMYARNVIRADKDMRPIRSSPG